MTSVYMSTSYIRKSQPEVRGSCLPKTLLPASLPQPFFLNKPLTSIPFESCEFFYILQTTRGIQRQNIWFCQTQEFNSTSSSPQVRLYFLPSPSGASHWRVLDPPTPLVRCLLYFHFPQGTSSGLARVSVGKWIYLGTPVGHREFHGLGPWPLTLVVLGTLSQLTVSLTLSEVHRKKCTIL